MKGYWLRIRRALAYFAALLASLAVVGFLVMSSWRAAKPTDATTPRRLLWYVEAEVNIPRGSRIVPGLIVRRLGRLPERPLVTTQGEALGRFAAADIPAHAPLTPNQLSPTPPWSAPVDGGVVPVLVKSDQAVGLAPGAFVAFVKDTSLIPPGGRRARGPHWGFRLRSLIGGKRDSTTTTLLIEVPAEHYDAVRFLATGEWRPVAVNPSPGHRSLAAIDRHALPACAAPHLRSDP